MQQAIPQYTQLFLFVIEDCSFCCPTAQVLTLLSPPSLTRVPLMPDFARGAFDYQSQTASVISLRHKLHFGSEDRDDGVVLLSRIDTRIAGFWVDAVDEVVEADQVQWLGMPEGFQDRIFSHAVQYEGRTAFYVDLHALWRHQQETLVAIQGLDPQLLHVLEEAVETPPPEPVAVAQHPFTEAVVPGPEQTLDEVHPIELPVETTTEPSLATAEPVLDEPPEQEETLMAHSPGTEPQAAVAMVDAGQESQPLADQIEEQQPAPEYRVAAATAWVDDEPLQRVPAVAETAEEAPPPRGQRRYRWAGLLLLVLLFLVPVSAYYYLRSLPQDQDQTTMAAGPATPVTPPLPVLTDTTPPPLIQVQKQALENPPPNVVQHIVVEGDTLWGISTTYLNNPWLYPELAQDSRIRNPDRIYPGEVVIIQLQESEHN